MSGLGFAGVIGQDDAKLALILAAIDPRLGGVLLRGDKGSAKSTLARGLAGLLVGRAPFVELPIGATDDAVTGSLDIGAAMSGEGVRVRPGLLAAAHGGVLYVDEVNLLPAHLVDLLLDAAASGVHRLERDGVSAEQPSRFVLIGSMNPEEGELRPQLLDRFGLVVEVRAPLDAAERAAAVRANLDGSGDGTGEAELARRLAVAEPGLVPDDVVAYASRLALAVGAEGLRADLALCRGAAALAGWEGRREATEADVERVAAMALAHRRRRRPFDPPRLPPDELAAALAEAAAASGQQSHAPADQRWGDLGGREQSTPVPMPPPRRPDEGPTVRGPVVGDRPPGDGGPRSMAVGATVRASVRRGGGAVTLDDVREPVRRAPAGRCTVLVVDTSGSMAVADRVEAATAGVLGLLEDAYRTRARVALIALHGGGAEVVVPPTASVEVARARLADVAAGGSTPLAEGIDLGLSVVGRVRGEGDDAVLVVLTDGRATAGADALDRALAAASRVADARIEAVVLDAEVGGTRLGLAGQLAAAMGARLVALPELSGRAVAAALGA